MSFDLPFRQIHLDFHTGPQIPDVGQDFDADAFGDRLAEARVNSVTLFAKCHHGHLFYNTKHPARHPGLKPGLDLLGEQIEACKRRGIRTPIYISIQCDEYAAHTHPEWLAVNAEGGKYFGGPLQACWHILDMSSPYQDYVADQISEVLKKFGPCDGLFLDMCWDQQSVSKYAIDGMRKAGLDPTVEADRVKYSHQVSLSYMARYKKLADDAHRGAGRVCPVAFNSRPLGNLPEEIKFLRHVEIEALPSGGWGYSYFPINVRFVRTFGEPYMGMTARFHKSWADFGGLKPAAALKYECAQMLAHGARCSVGDQLHPRGILDRAAYELIGSVYSHVEACEPWCKDATPVVDIALLRGNDGSYHLRPGGPEEGAMRVLQQLQYQFDIVPSVNDLSPYKLVIVPESMKIDTALAAKLSKYVKAGGSLLISGAAAVNAEGKPAIKDSGVVAHGDSPFTTTYVRFDKAISEGVAPADHVIYERGLRLTAAAGATVLARVVEPYFERRWDHFSSHFQTPGDKLSKYAAAIQRGRIITVSFPALQSYGTHGNLPVKQLLAHCIRRLLPEPLLRADLASHVETTVNRQGKRTVVHVLSYAPQRRTPNLDLVEDPTPIVDAPIAVRLDREPRTATLQPAGKAIPFEWRDGRASIRLTLLDGHVMVVFE